MKVLVVLVCGLLGSARACYWNEECPFLLHSTKTPYDTVRGDIRDYDTPQNCEAVSIWTLNRHGNRNPGSSVTDAVKEIARLQEDIIASYDSGQSLLCAQDIDLFRKWTWNDTLEESQSFLTGTGYEELYSIGARIRQKYPHLLLGEAADYYFRSTNEQRTITSAMAFVHGLTDGTGKDLPVDGVRERDDVIRPYENCDRYQQEVKNSPILDEQLEAYFVTSEFIAVQNAVQERLYISTRLSPESIYAFYELCRFDRSWNLRHQSPWCSVFSNEDLEVLEYRDDIRHYYRNGYGSWVNVNLGGPPLKDMYETLEGAINGTNRKITSYFTHDTMLDMVYCAMGAFKDDSPILGSYRDPNRNWRTSFIAPFSVNLMAVLKSCTTDTGDQEYRVQLFINEKETEICPLEGCTWAQFQERFQKFTAVDLEFCSMDYRVEPADNSVSNTIADVKECREERVTHVVIRTVGTGLKGVSRGTSDRACVVHAAPSYPHTLDTYLHGNK